MTTSTALLLASALACTAPATAQDPTIPTTKSEARAQWQQDGLEQIEVRDLDLVFARPGASLSGYDRIQLGPIPVAFRRNWERQMRADRQRIAPADIARIREQLGELVHEVVREELESGGYVLTQSPGEDVLAVQMAIVDLHITAPDVASSGRNRVYTTSVGEMTLSAELRDSSSGELLVRLIDRRVGRQSMRPEFTTQADNVAEARRAARAWAQALRRGLDQARTIGSTP